MGSNRRWLDEIGDVHGHLVDLGAVVLLDVAEDANVVVHDEVDGDTLAAEATGAADPVNVELAVVGQVVVDDERDLLHVDAARPHVRGDEHPAHAAAELLHDGVALRLLHVAVHGRDGEVRLAHLLRQPVDLASRVAEYHRLRDRQRVVQVAERVELPLLALHGHEELLDAVESQLVALDQDANRVGHELGGHLEYGVWQRGADQTHLGLRRQVAVHVVDLLLEALVEHLVGLVQYEHLDVARLQVMPMDHVDDAAGRARDDVLAVVELLDVVAQARAANARVTLHVHEVAEGEHHLLDLDGEFARRREHERLGLAQLRVDHLQHGDGEGGRLARARLRLGDDVAARDDGHNGALLDGRGLLEAVAVDAAQELLFELHAIECGQHLHVLARLELDLLQLLQRVLRIATRRRRGLFRSAFATHLSSLLWCVYFRVSSVGVCVSANEI